MSFSAFSYLGIKRTLSPTVMLVYPKPPTQYSYPRPVTEELNKECFRLGQLNKLLQNRIENDTDDFNKTYEEFLEMFNIMVSEKSILKSMIELLAAYGNNVKDVTPYLVYFRASYNSIIKDDELSQPQKVSELTALNKRWEMLSAAEKRKYDYHTYISN